MRKDERWPVHDYMKVKNSICLLVRQTVTETGNFPFPFRWSFKNSVSVPLDFPIFRFRSVFRWSFRHGKRKIQKFSVSVLTEIFSVPFRFRHGTERNGKRNGNFRYSVTDWRTNYQNHTTGYRYKIPIFSTISKYVVSIIWWYKKHFEMFWKSVVKMRMVRVRHSIRLVRKEFR